MPNPAFGEQNTEKEFPSDESGAGSDGGGTNGESGSGESTSHGDGDSDTASQGDGDGSLPGDGDGDGDEGSPSDTSLPGDGDGDGDEGSPSDTTPSGDGDGAAPGDGDGDGDGTLPGDGDGDMTATVDGSTGGSGSTGDGDGDLSCSPSGLEDPICGSCVEENCCPALEQCLAHPDCECVWTCTALGSDVDTCLVIECGLGALPADFVSITSCMEASCANECSGGGQGETG